MRSLKSLSKTLKVLAEQLEEEKEIPQLFTNDLLEFKKDNVEIEEQFFAFLQTGKIPSDSRIFKVLKCLHSDIIFPAYLSLRMAFYDVNFFF